MNSNKARRGRAMVALSALVVAGFIGLDMFSATYIVKSAGADFRYEFAWSVIGWLLGIAVVFFGWNILTYNRPRYARRRG